MLKKTTVKTHTYEAGVYTDETGYKSKWYVDIREDDLHGNPTWSIAYRVGGIWFVYDAGWGLCRDKDTPLKKVLKIVENRMDEDKALYCEELECSEWTNYGSDIYDKIVELFNDLPTKFTNPLVFGMGCPYCEEE